MMGRITPRSEVREIDNFLCMEMKLNIRVN